MPLGMAEGGADEVGPANGLGPDSAEGRREVLRRMLEEVQADVLSRVRALRSKLPDASEHVRDVQEAGAEDVARTLEITLAKRGIDTLRRIDDALKRLDEGAYGLCQRCGGVIPEARLRALPFAARCQECQRRAESEAPVRPARR